VEEQRRSGHNPPAPLPSGAVREPTAIWWLRRDLRRRDNPALNAAADVGPVLPVFVLDDALWGPAGAARRAFLAGSLRALDASLGGHLVIRHGDPAVVLPRVASDAGATTVVAAEDFGPYGRRRDARAAAALTDAGVSVRWTGSPYAVAPGSVVKGDGAPYGVFTAFSRAWAAHGWDEPVAPPRRIAWVSGVDGVGIPDAPGVDATLPTPGEAAAGHRWRRFLDTAADGYATGRDTPAGDHTSRLSPYLRWGALHPRTLLAGLDPGRRGHQVFRAELCWREFYADVLWHRPDTARRSLQRQMAGMRLDTGRRADERFAAWAEGRTGYPIVDAGMRQLRAEAWMHNRLRMIVASFLVKDLHIDWTRGARFFMQHLVDGDLASNSHGWQWVAGTGTDAAPYFRVFNPVTQGRKFDPDGAYVRRWVPELASLPDRWIHRPWEAPELTLEAADYPDPIVHHHAEREEALDRYQAVRAGDGITRRET
jgi:deoxyribodipyrimidine photo-lyase